MSKERPILFSGEMVRAILDGRKTQTRRVIKPQPIWDDGSKSWEFGWCSYWPKNNYVHTWDDDGIGGPNWTGENYPNEDTLSLALDASPNSKKCPHGKPGDKLWVRETFADVRGMGFDHPEKPGFKWDFSYKADCSTGELNTAEAYGVKWKPSIFMPRSVSRISLEITNVRVERLQDISEEDAIEEGIERQPEHNGPMKYSIRIGDGSFNQPTAKECFEYLWSSINGAESWESNPWVWVIDFIVIKLERTPKHS